MKDFIKAIYWWRFFKIIGSVTLILFLITIVNPKPYWPGVIFIPILLSIMLLLSVHSAYLINKPKESVLSVKEIRKMKLKKIKKRW